jgi:hypothetical protein
MLVFDIETITSLKPDITIRELKQMRRLTDVFGKKEVYEGAINKLFDKKNLKK